SYWRAEEARRKEVHQGEVASQARDAERWERYRANLATVASAFEAQHVAVARRALDDAPTEHRGWEWHHFHHQLDGSQRVLTGHRGTVRNVFFLKNGLMGTVDSVLRLWDTATGKLLTTLPDYSFNPIPLLAVSPDGQLLAYPAGDTTVVLWDIAVGRKRAVLD